MCERVPLSCVTALWHAKPCCSRFQAGMGVLVRMGSPRGQAQLKPPQSVVACQDAGNGHMMCIKA